jgi:hypothetical protein
VNGVYASGEFHPKLFSRISGQKSKGKKDTAVISRIQDSDNRPRLTPNGRKRFFQELAVHPSTTNFQSERQIILDDGRDEVAAIKELNESGIS